MSVTINSVTLIQTLIRDFPKNSNIFTQLARPNFLCVIEAVFVLNDTLSKAGF